jgi:hypothetical protein
VELEAAKVLERLVGPLVLQGMPLSVAELVARRRAFEAGEYDGDICDCGRRSAWLWPHAGTNGLCDRCHEAWGVPGRDPRLPLPGVSNERRDHVSGV